MIKKVKENVFEEKRATLLMATPSCLYALQNNMVFLALVNLNVPTQQVSTIRRFLAIKSVLKFMLDIGCP